MKDNDIVILVIFVLLAMSILFFGMRNFFQKSIKHTPAVESTTTTKKISEQERRARDVREQQKQLMRAQKQRIRDMSR